MAITGVLTYRLILSTLGGPHVRPLIMCDEQDRQTLVVVQCVDLQVISGYYILSNGTVNADAKCHQPSANTIPRNSLVFSSLTYSAACSIRGCVLFIGPAGPGRPGQGPGVLFWRPAMLANVLFYRPGQPKVGPAVEFGRYRPRPRPSLFVFA